MDFSLSARLQRIMITLAANDLRVLDSHLACLRTVTTDFPNDFVHHPLAFSLLLMLERMHASQREENCTSADAARPLSTPSPTLPLIVTPSTKTMLEKEATHPPIPLIKIEDEDVIVLDDDKENATKVEEAKRAGAEEGRNVSAPPGAAKRNKVVEQSGEINVAGPHAPQSQPLSIPTITQPSIQPVKTPPQISAKPMFERQAPRSQIPVIKIEDDDIIVIDEEKENAAKENGRKPSTPPTPEMRKRVSDHLVEMNVAWPHTPQPPPPNTPFPTKIEQTWDVSSVVAVDGDRERDDLEEEEEEEEKHEAEEGPSPWHPTVVIVGNVETENVVTEEEEERERDAAVHMRNASTSTEMAARSGGLQQSERVETREADLSKDTTKVDKVSTIPEKQLHNYSCPFCPIVWTLGCSSLTLAVHIHVEHRDENGIEFRCTECPNFRTQRPLRLLAHAESATCDGDIIFKNPTRKRGRPPATTRNNSSAESAEASIRTFFIRCNFCNALWNPAIPAVDFSRHLIKNHRNVAGTFWICSACPTHRGRKIKCVQEHQKSDHCGGSAVFQHNRKISSKRKRSPEDDEDIHDEAWVPIRTTGPGTRRSGRLSEVFGFQSHTHISETPEDLSL